MSSTNVDLILRDPIAAKRSYSESHRISIAKDGTVRGNLSKQGVPVDKVNLNSMKAFLIKDGKLLDTAFVARNGYFSFPSVTPGCYGLLAAGPGGVAAVSFCAVNNNSVAENSNQSEVRFVSFVADGPSSELNVELADGSDVISTQKKNASTTPPEEVAAVEEEVVTDEAVPITPASGANMAGAGQIIGGGGGSPLGGLGEQLTNLAGAGLIAYGLSQLNNNNDNNNNQIVSPIVAIQ